MSPTEIIDASVAKAEIVEYLGSVIDDAQSIANAVKDDVSANQAADLGVAIKTKLAWLKTKRAEVYEPLYQATERVRLEFDNPIKLGTQLEKTIGAAVIKYKLDKKREEERLRLAAEADARRIREEAARKEREVQAERDRIIKEQEDRERRRREAEAAEERRIQAEAKAREDADRARIQKEQDERAQRIKEEENARLAKAQEAQDVGLEERVDSILERPTAIAPIAKPLPTKAELEAAAEADRKRQAEEAAIESQRQAREKEEERLRAEESERMKRMQEEADRATAEAEAAEAAAAAQVSVTQADTRMRNNTSAKYQITDEASFRKLVKAVAEGRAPIEFLGFNMKEPAGFRSPAIGKRATEIKNKPDFAALQAELLAVGITVWLEESGTFKAEKEVA